MSDSINLNRLVNETSPYLRQHATNPVDWRPWDTASLAEARQSGRPIFLSIGYSSCHWCHVMERESFSTCQAGDALNRHFIPIKVDREEHPEVDHLCMTATQMLTGSGGWPNNLWLTPDLRPFYAGTYFPPEAFVQLCSEIAKAWELRRSDLEARASRVADVVEQVAARNTARPQVALNRDLVERGWRELRESFDRQQGGFSGAPKFPPHNALRFLLESAVDHESPSARDSVKLATLTLRRMAEGGIRDHLGGGFHRYSTDQHWLVPHFEKMLYDNALLLVNYSLGWQATGDPEFRRAATEIAAWLLREMQAPDGGFYAAQDADSEGEEGACYLWTLEQVRAALEPPQAELLAEVYGLREEGNFVHEVARRETGRLNILHLPLPVADFARRRGLDEADLRERLRKARERLLEHRRQRVPPARDDKILTDWNGLAVFGLARAGGVLGEDSYLDAAAKAAEHLLRDKVGAEGNLAHCLRAWHTPIGGFIDDYAFFIRGLLELSAWRDQPVWRETAEELAWRAVAEFADRRRGGFYLTGKSSPPLLRRHCDPFDQVTPSGNAMMVECLLLLYRQTRRRSYLEIAERTLTEFSGAVAAAPLACLGMLTALHHYLQDEEKG